jgi:hypothetical protein
VNTENGEPSKFDVDAHVDALNGFGNDGLWELGRYISECLLPDGIRYRQSRDRVLEEIASHPKARHPYNFIKQCLQLYTLYPDLTTRPLPENYYFDLAVRVFDDDIRSQYEGEALD